MEGVLRLISTYVAVLLYGWSVCAATDFITITVPKSEQTLKTLGTSHSYLDYRNLKLVTWNTQKFPSPQTLTHFQSLQKYSDLFLVQEFFEDNRVRKFLSPQDHADFSIGFLDSNNFATGVATFSKGKPYQSRSIQSIGREPILKTPKMILVQKYFHPEISNELLVLNIHGINFVEQHTYQSQINQAMAYIRNHEGPIIFAGDFNTWNDARWNYLRTLMHIYGLIDIQIPRTTHLILDHIFIRGFKAQIAYSMENITSSDHYPLFAELSLESP